MPWTLRALGLGCHSGSVSVAHSVETVREDADMHDNLDRFSSPQGAESESGLTGDAKLSQHYCAEHAEPQVISVTIKKTTENSVYGVRMVDTEDQEAGLLIMFISEAGVLSDWNKNNASMAVSVGDSIVEANGRTTPWGIMEEMTKSSQIHMKVRRSPPGASEFLASCTITDKLLNATALVLKHTVRAGDASTESCAICLDDVDPDERIARLDCGHGFHQKCVVMWLGRQKEGRCPLCRDSVQLRKHREKP